MMLEREKMETFYLIDFENVHNEGLKGIDSLSGSDHVHIFSTENAVNIRMDLAFPKGVAIQPHLVPARKQSVDMHLVSYLGFLLGNHGKQCSYVIVSKDTDYDNIIAFWKKEGYMNVLRKKSIQDNIKKKNAVQKASANVQVANNKISAGMAFELSGKDKCELNVFMQRGLASKGYAVNAVNRACRCVFAHCNDERMLFGIHNDLRNEFKDYAEVYADVKTVLEKFVASKSKPSKREAQVRSFFGQHFKKKVYLDRKEEIIEVILHAKSRQQINNGLFKIYSDGSVVKQIFQTMQPLIKDLPGV
ncbi:MAG: PIN domain-containing protein [Ruminococcus flavefaciens]|nr:PIN domain-containing protein [Ruminococcus flavefaciens]